MPRSPEQVDDSLVSHEVRMDSFEGRIRVLEGRIGSYADAELAYRQAEAAIKRQQSEFSDEHAKMLTSAKKILDGAVAKAVEPFAEPLAVVREIRDAQTTRHTRELLLAEIALASKKKRDTALKYAAGVAALAVSLAELWRMLKG